MKTFLFLLFLTACYHVAAQDSSLALPCSILVMNDSPLPGTESCHNLMLKKAQKRIAHQQEETRLVFDSFVLIMKNQFVSPELATDLACLIANDGSDVAIEVLVENLLLFKEDMNGMVFEGSFDHPITKDRLHVPMLTAIYRNQLRSRVLAYMIEHNKFDEYFSDTRLLVGQREYFREVLISLSCGDPYFMDKMNEYLNTSGIQPIAIEYLKEILTNLAVGVTKPECGNR